MFHFKVQTWKWYFSFRFSWWRNKNNWNQHFPIAWNFLVNLLVLIVNHIKERKCSLFRIKKIKTEGFWAKQELFVVQELLTEQDKELVSEKVQFHMKQMKQSRVFCVFWFFSFIPGPRQVMKLKDEPLITSVRCQGYLYCNLWSLCVALTMIKSMGNHLFHKWAETAKVRAFPFGITVARVLGRQISAFSSLQGSLHKCILY